MHPLTTFNSITNLLTQLLHLKAKEKSISVILLELILSSSNKQPINYNSLSALKEAIGGILFFIIVRLALNAFNKQLIN